MTALKLRIFFLAVLLGFMPCAPGVAAAETRQYDFSSVGAELIPLRPFADQSPRAMSGSSATPEEARALAPALGYAGGDVEIKRSCSGFL